jgi:Ala-tRNA(Pro) deacylase
MSVPKWIESTLENEHVAFEERHHTPRYTAQEVAAEEHFCGHRLAKVVIVKADGGMAEVVAPATRRINLQAVARELGCDACRLATEQEISEHFADCEVGAVPPLRHWPGVPILLDEQLTNLPGTILFQAGTHEDAIEMEFEDWYRITQPRVGEFTWPTG